MTPTSNGRQFLATVAVTAAGSCGLPRLLRAQVPAAAAAEIGTYLNPILRIINRHHDVSLAFRPDDGEWIALATTCETSGYHHNVFGGLLDLRPALTACGQGEVRFSSLVYRNLA